MARSLPSAGVAEQTDGRPESAETQTRILDAAEALFIENGYSATSLRAVASRAGANLAAAHYHFGSKEGLLRACVHRRLQPVQQTSWLSNKLGHFWLGQIGLHGQPGQHSWPLTHNLQYSRSFRPR